MIWIIISILLCYAIYFVCFHHDDILRITNTTDFVNLKDTRPSALLVRFSNIGDVHPFGNLCFPNAETIVIVDCNKNFTYYWLTPKIFPNVKEIYLMSHPCDYCVCSRFTNVSFYLASRYSCYATSPVQFVDSSPF
jgi:hypothetical protein